PLVDGRVVAAQRAVGIARDLHLAELHAQAVEQEQSVHQRVAKLEDQLDGLDRLDRADDAAHGAQNARFSAAGHDAWRGWRREEAAIAALAWQEHVCAALKAE